MTPSQYNASDAAVTWYLRARYGAKDPSWDAILHSFRTLRGVPHPRTRKQPIGVAK